MSPYTLAKRPFHVIVKHMMATETSGDCQPGNVGLRCGVSTHRTEIFCVCFSTILEKIASETECILSKTHPLTRITNRGGPVFCRLIQPLHINAGLLATQ